MQTQPLQGHSILIVEDEPLIALDIEMILVDYGAHVTSTNTLRHALILVEHDGLSAAVLDHAIDGAHSSSPLYDRLNARGIPFLIYSAHSLSEEDRKGGAYLAKPAVPEDLATAVGELLRMH